ncbi:MAG: CocE/NonD family hydrolase, partial [Pseudomonadota bacterium]
ATLLLLPPHWQESLIDVVSPWHLGVQRERNMMVAMRDGVHLRTEVLLPTGSDGPWPTILIRSPYRGYSLERRKFFVDHGYAVVFQHVRGRYGSEGQFSPYRFAGADGSDTLDWIVAQPWANDMVGTFGCSYLGESQMILAAEQHPAHRALVAEGAGGGIGSAGARYNYFGVYENGVLNLASLLGWAVSEGATGTDRTRAPDDLAQRMQRNLNTLPIRDIASRVVGYPTVYEPFIDHALTDPWWRKQGFVSNADQFATPGLHFTSWFDQTAADTLALAELMRRNATNDAAQHQSVVVGPGTHCSHQQARGATLQVGELTVTDADADFLHTSLAWFDHWLKQDAVPLPPALRTHVLIEDDWHTPDQWPLPDSQQWFLHADGVLRASPPSSSARWRYDYDPHNPVPTRGGAFCCTGNPNDQPGVFDQADLAQREDVLSFTTEALNQPVRLLGAAEVSLTVQSSAPDTDFTAKLVDITPDGRHLSLQDSVIRLRYRDGVEAPSLVVPGARIRIRIPLRPIGWLFKPGHRIGLHISSSNAPRLARNLNTGAHEYRDDDIAVATNIITTSQTEPLTLTLPILP